jgi:ParB/RepB/Spo0J family partition protein
LARKPKLQLGKLQYLPTNRIEPSKWGIRKATRTGTLHRSIEQVGILQNICVRPVKGGNFQAIFGDGRLLEAQRLHINKIPAIVVDTNEKVGLLLHAIENFSRDDLSPIEEAELLATLQSQGRFTLDDLAEIFQGRFSRSKIGTRIEMHWKLTDKAKAAVSNGSLPLKTVEMALDELSVPDANRALEIMISKKATDMPSALEVMRTIKPDIKKKVRYRPRKHREHEPEASKAPIQTPTNWITIYRFQIQGEVAGVDDKGIYVREKDPNRAMRYRLFEQIEVVKLELMKKARHGDLLSFSVKLESPLVAEEPKAGKEKQETVSPIAATENQP